VKNGFELGLTNTWGNRAIVFPETYLLGREAPKGSKAQGRKMEKGEELDQFEVLEEKLDALIGYVESLKREKDVLAEKMQIQDEKISDMAREIETLRSARDQAKQRIVTLLEKIEQVAL
jgi:uncharacterized coiled-coil DUF342 family protein